MLGEGELDPTLRRLRQQVADRLSVRRTRRRGDRRGPGPPVSARWRDSEDDVDVERTVEALLARRPLDEHDIVVRVDASVSMSGPKALLAAAAVGALGAELAREELTVVAFWQDAAVLRRAVDARPLDAVLGDLVRLRAEGLTNVGVGLHVAARELSRSGAPRRAAVLLSDCVHNAGPDPRPLASRLPRLHVLVQAQGEHDEALARDLARIGGGHFARVTHPHEVAEALNRAMRT